ncbi:histone [archaeon]|jgi:DNA-binding protein|nr:histone [archaeon]MBT4351267.1 histone [archaeon]MBT4648215.1 histone [archaeon]MBT6822265.1 histone [archaeon]MBT7392639.1 histone [archaeon]
MTKKIISLHSMEKIMKAAGAQRVSEKAKEELREILEEIGGKISHQAIIFSKHAGRKTIKKEDIKLAKKSF